MRLLYGEFRTNLGFRPEVELMETSHSLCYRGSPATTLGFRPEVELMET